MVHFRADGYVEICANAPDNSTERILLHRLLGVAEYGFDAVAGNDIHHINGVKWDNRPSNIEPVNHGYHSARHKNDRFGDRAYRDEGVLRELFVNKGMSSPEVADELNTSTPTVLRWLRKHDIDIIQDDYDYRDEGVLREHYIERGKTAQEVGDEFDVSDKTILRWLGKHDIKTREAGR